MLTALHLQLQLESLGLQTVGIATDREQARRLANDGPDVAFVDMNLRDGPTGTEIAAFLAERGVRVFFVTANPAQLGDGRNYALGVINKPWNEADIRGAVQRIR